MELIFQVHQILFEYKEKDQNTTAAFQSFGFNRAYISAMQSIFIFPLHTKASTIALPSIFSLLCIIVFLFSIKCSRSNTSYGSPDNCCIFKLLPIQALTTSIAIALIFSFQCDLASRANRVWTCRGRLTNLPHTHRFQLSNSLLPGLLCNDYSSHNSDPTSFSYPIKPEQRKPAHLCTIPARSVRAVHWVIFLFCIYNLESEIGRLSMAQALQCRNLYLCHIRHHDTRSSQLHVIAPIFPDQIYGSVIVREV